MIVSSCYFNTQRRDQRCDQRCRRGLAQASLGRVFSGTP